jgi:hypothetical protein
MKVEHLGWPDHYPPPFEYMEPILTSIHTHLCSNEKATAVLHCKGMDSLVGMLIGSWERTFGNYCGFIFGYPCGLGFRKGIKAFHDTADAVWRRS